MTVADNIQSFYEQHQDSRLVELLQRSTVIAEHDLQAAQYRSQKAGTMLAEELVVAGLATPKEAWSALGVLWDSPIINIETEPVDKRLLSSRPSHEFVTAGWAPWCYSGENELTIVTSVQPDERLLRSARARYNASRIITRTISPNDLETAIENTCKDQLLYLITDAHADSNPTESAREGMHWWQKWLPFGLPLLLLVIGFFYTNDIVVAVFLGTNVIFYLFIIFKSYLAIRVPLKLFFQNIWQRALGAARRDAGIPTLSNHLRRIPDRDLPVYTLLIPVFREANIVGKLVDNLDKLDYPKSKLQVLILLEEEDTETIEAAYAANPPPYMTVMVVPDGQPRTKPRACNYGLALARGKYVVIYDAEDKPDPQQLRTAVAAFDENRFRRAYVDPKLPELVCVQAALSYFNSDYNLLTRLFSIEYSHWFDAMLPGMDGIGFPMPLGGTSNHFIASVLRDIGAWDPYNVTEDADLGMRISNRGFAIGNIRSSTGEEACAETGAWIKQRTRWIKGYLITSAVYLSRPLSFLRRNGIGGAISMILLVLGTPISFMVYPLSLLFTLITWFGVQFRGLHFPEWLLQATLLVMVFGIGMLIATSALAAGLRYGWRLAMYAFLTPAYWFLHSIAAWRAAYQSIFDPHRWEKTPHGLTEDYVTEEEH